MHSTQSSANCDTIAQLALLPTFHIVNSIGVTQPAHIEGVTVQVRLHSLPTRQGARPAFTAHNRA